MSKTVFMDLGNVLVGVNEKKAIKLFADEFGIKEEKIKKVSDSELEQDFADGKIDMEEYIQELNNFFTNSNKEFTFSRLLEIWESPFTKIDSTERILEQLLGQTRVFALSNTNPLHIAAVKSNFPGLLEKFQKKIYSYDAGASKPKKEIYEYALDVADARANNSIFIDDLEENVEGAKKVGIQAHQYQNEKELIKFLRKHGFNVE